MSSNDRQHIGMGIGACTIGAPGRYNAIDTFTATLQRDGITRHTLQRFYARHKYLVMSRDVAAYRRIGKMLATMTAADVPAVAQQTIELIMAALQKPSTRGGNVNALMHIRGYLKRALSTEEKIELGEVIEQYRRGDVPLVVPITLLRHHFRRHPDSYIEQQLFMRPYPETLQLRNHL